MVHNACPAWIFEFLKNSSNTHTSSYALRQREYNVLKRSQYKVFRRPLDSKWTSFGSCYRKALNGVRISWQQSEFFLWDQLCVLRPASSSIGTQCMKAGPAIASSAFYKKRVLRNFVRGSKAHVVLVRAWHSLCSRKALSSAFEGVRAARIVFALIPQNAPLSKQASL